MSKSKTKRAPTPPPPLPKPGVPVRDRMLVAAIALAGSVAGIRNDFAFDDVPLIVNNEHVNGLDHLSDILTSSYWPSPFAHELYRPLATLLMAIQYAIGNGPLVFRIVSYLLYALSAVAVLSLATRLVAPGVALGMALIFAAHPIHVEAVALGVNQGELLVAILGAAMVTYYLDRRKAADLVWRDWLILGGMYAAASLIKENGFVLPGLLIAAEVILIAGVPSNQRMQALWRGYASLALIGVILLAVRTAVLSGSVAGAVPAEALKGLGLGGRALTMLAVVPRWLRLLVWPLHLQADYSPNEIVASTGWGIYEVGGAAIVVAVLALAQFTRRRIPVICFGLAWCAVALFPVSNLIVPTGIVLAERTLFLPSIGFLLAVGGAADYLIERYPVGIPRLRESLQASCAVLVVLGLVRSASRQQAWRNTAHLWSVTAIDAPKSLRVKQAHIEAVSDLRKDFDGRIAASPSPWQVRAEYGALLKAMGEDTAAVTQLRLSLAEDAQQPDVRLELATELLALGRYSEATEVAIVSTSDSSITAALARIAALADSADRVSARSGSVHFTKAARRP